MRGFRITGCGAGLVGPIVLASASVLGAALLGVGVEAAGSQTGGPKKIARTYDVRITGSVTATAPEAVLVEKGTQVYRRVRVLVIESNGRVSVVPADTPSRKPNGTMSGEVTYRKTGSAPCSQSKEFRGPARLDVSAQGGRSFTAAGIWAGARGGTELKPPCPGLVDLAGGDEAWQLTKGRTVGEFSSSHGGVAWVLRARPGGPLEFPLSRLYAGRSFGVTVAGTTNDGLAVRKGSVQVTFTPRR